ncbi:zinc-containing alcohol dehydrogenase [Microlunatus phosphovorus NM-1]|uniref:Zinc-containing alcohol dehydrogenase n=1 Tax=Microlunatus phosphovorus (strain ATCC 700054 / DSM 10555 / JCM 9379 / NBRC 101784 / NCIMB 13414 / VKM Ac-1990 / NM-1) TaxID=1032480 RepID=F5XJ20_MICPN|nr:alcohol dehydrogenase catalytic domain-containing protein [Microlunatus phosphovorus]BAK33346.1 zinc-containing alcohol dehydrogenase [Microlunatus phosphovorus NM-1]
MKALVLHGDYDIRVEDRPVPSPGPSDVVVAVIATGICGSDFHGYSGENGRRHPGQIMGHETVGRIQSVGSAVTGLDAGQLVTINPMMVCGSCDVCLAGRGQWCGRRVVLGVTPEPPAAFADLVAVPATNIVVLPESMPAELGALVEPMAVGYHAVRRGGIAADDRVLVIGGGPIGQACLMAARREGVTAVAVSDISPSRRALCARLGANVIDPIESDLATATAEALGGPATLVVDAVGISRTLEDAFAASGLGARIVLVGMGAPRVELPAYAVSTEERTLVGSFTYTAEEFAATAAWVGTVPEGIEALIDGRVGWDGAPKSFDDLARGRTSASKILVFPQGPPATEAGS